MNRRELLIGTAAITAANSLPSLPLAPPATAAPGFPAWAIGTDGGMDWRIIFAATERQAREEYLEDEHGGGCEGCDIDECICFGKPEAQREPSLDRFYHSANVPDSALFGLGWLVHCGRCGYETGRGDGRPIGNEVVCFECMTEDERAAR